MADNIFCQLVSYKSKLFIHELENSTALWAKISNQTIAMINDFELQSLIIRIFHLIFKIMRHEKLVINPSSDFSRSLSVSKFGSDRQSIRKFILNIQNPLYRSIEIHRLEHNQKNYISDYFIEGLWLDLNETSLSFSLFDHDLNEELFFDISYKSIAEWRIIEICKVELILHLTIRKFNAIVKVYIVDFEFKNYIQDLLGRKCDSNLDFSLLKTSGETVKTVVHSKASRSKSQICLFKDVTDHEDQVVADFMLIDEDDYRTPENYCPPSLSPIKLTSSSSCLPAASLTIKRDGAIFNPSPSNMSVFVDASTLDTNIESLDVSIDGYLEHRFSNVTKYLDELVNSICQNLISKVTDSMKMAIESQKQLRYDLNIILENYKMARPSLRTQDLVDLPFEVISDSDPFKTIKPIKK